MFLNDNETATDLLYYESISKTVVHLITGSGQAPVSIGIHGDWGAVKSSILAMIAHLLEADENVVCVRFNGWQFQGFEDAKTVVIERILGTLERSKPVLAKGKEKIVSLFKRVKWFKLARKAGGLLLSAYTGLPINSLTDFAVDQIKERVKSGEEIGEYLSEAETKTLPDRKSVV